MSAYMPVIDVWLKPKEGAVKDAYRVRVPIPIGAVAKWAMEGPPREDGSTRKASDLDGEEEARVEDIIWVLWASLGSSDSFVEFRDRVLRYTNSSEEEDASEDPKDLTT